MAVVVVIKGRPEASYCILANEVKPITKPVSLTDVIHGGDFSSRYNKWHLYGTPGEWTRDRCHKSRMYDKTASPNNSKPRRKEHRVLPLKHVDCSAYWELT